MRYKHIKHSEAEKYEQAGGESTTFLATAPDTDGRVSIFDSVLKKGNGAPWHYHDTDDEIFYVMSGEVEFGINDEISVAVAGDLVIAGPGVHRRFTALSDSRLLVINAPAGPSEGFLREITQTEMPPSEEKVQHFIDEYGIHIV